MSLFRVRGRFVGGGGMLVIDVWLLTPRLFSHSRPGEAAMLFSKGSGALSSYSREPICGPVVTFLLHARLLSKILSKHL